MLFRGALNPRILSRMAPSHHIPKPCSVTEFRPVEAGGRIELIIGPMFAGKTTELIRLARRQALRPHSVLVIRFDEDDRYSKDDIATHDGITSKMTVISATKLLKVKQVCDAFQVIAVDEGQFFPDIVEFCENLANSGKVVLVSALDGDYKRQPFKHIMSLIPLSEKVCKLDAVCQGCGGNASFSKRLGNETAVKVIGKEDKYMAVCRTCYQKPDLCSPHKPMAQVSSTKRKSGDRMETSPKRKLLID